jgi:DNA-binding response OmpR family regulator
MAHLLIVDDTVDTCHMLRRLFAKCGHTSACLHDGTGVLDALHGVRHDLVLLDVMMPRMDGFEVLAAVRACPIVGRTPIAMYSAIGDAAQQERALAMGADEWIVKGTPFPLLQKRLECFLRPAGASGEG